jgi:hypothetical protein
MARRVFAAAVILLLLAGPVHAQGQPPAGKSHRAVGTIVGAAAGFGLGLWIGLATLDDDIDSEQRVLSVAIATAAAGGVAGYLLGRSRHAGAPAGTPSTKQRAQRLSDHEVAALARAIRMSGSF